ncbi:PREDICTED: extracellular calcium-sensing receptor-like [Nanorana parkeri]|uniref:extracellular calcium-sensing receptor-like n=1 Tax=Nanorana parkeri TaxID=125878 RepID=UPI000853F614|nr:PREDICTED: extracellular calcium-sensing receptor-like [Nanorana parkeri]
MGVLSTTSWSGNGGPFDHFMERMIVGFFIYYSTVSLCISFGQPLSCTLRSPSEIGYFQDGDILIGGFFPVHTSWKQQAYSFTERDQPVTCTGWIQAMIYAIREINADDLLLPNITLGFQIFDTCAHLGRALWGTFWTLTGKEHPIINYQCNQKTPVAIVGDSSSFTSVAMATVLRTFMYPQISYTASLASLNSRYLYPSFFRTIPSDDKQARALAKLVSYMGWNWVGLLSLDQEYGILGSQVLKEELQKFGVCLAYHETFGQATSSTKLKYIADIVARSSAKVVIIFSRDPVIHPLIELLLGRQDAKHIWLATEGWSNSQILQSKWYSSVMMGTLAVSLHEVGMPGFKEFLLDISPSTALPQDIFVKNAWEIIQECRWPDSRTTVDNGTVWCTGAEKLTRFRNNEYVFNEFDFKVHYLVYNAVYAVAHTLHDTIFNCMMGQNTTLYGECGVQGSILPWQVAQNLKKHRFKNRMGEEIYFDANGNPPTDYDVLNWHRNADGSIDFVKVGRYNIRESQENELSVNVTAIKWITGDAGIPKAVCSESCSPGFRKAQQNGQPLCCFDCIPCSEGHISSQRDSSNCLPCPSEMWPNKDNTICIPKLIDFLSYWEPLGITLTSTVIFCSFTTVSILCVFIKFKDTAIVKANNRDLTYLLLVSLSLSFLCSLLFIGEPQKFTCRFRQGAFGVIFVISVSCVLAKTVMVVIAFRATKPGSNMRRWLGPKVPASTVCVSTFIQIIICIYWLIQCPPFPEKNMTIKTEVIIFQCNECSDTLLWCMLGYMALLSCISFLVAFLARNLPDSFNEAKWITFSMLIFLSVWISFIPAYLSTQGKFMVAVEVFGILSSSAGIVGCIFFPKCYVILLRPELNTRQNILGKGTDQKTKTSIPMIQTSFINFRDYVTCRHSCHSFIPATFVPPLGPLGLEHQESSTLRLLSSSRSSLPPQPPAFTPALFASGQRAFELDSCSQRTTRRSRWNDGPSLACLGNLAAGCSNSIYNPSLVADKTEIQTSSGRFQNFDLPGVQERRRYNCARLKTWLWFRFKIRNVLHFLSNISKDEDIEKILNRRIEEVIHKAVQLTLT